MRLRRVAGCGALYGPRSRPRHPNPIPSHLDANPILLGVPSSLVRAPYSHMRVAIPSHIDIESPPRYSNMLQKRGGLEAKMQQRGGGKPDRRVGVWTEKCARRVGVFRGFCAKGGGVLAV